MDIGGVDASQSVRVEFIADATRVMLRDAHGTFELDLAGDKVVSSTFGDAGAQRTLELMRADLAPSDAAPGAAVSPASVPAGDLHPTDNACPTGSLIEDCSDLFYGQCDKGRFQDCMHDIGSAKAARVDGTLAAARGECTIAWSCDHYMRETEDWMMRARQEDSCPDCSGQWHTLPSSLWSDCPDSAWDYNGDAYWGFGKYNYCRLRVGGPLPK
jgi:hypothetical protein